MKRFLILSCILLVVFVSASWQKKNDSISEKTRDFILQEISNSKQQLILSKAGNNNLSQLQKFYIEARKHYKHVEFFIEYVSPREAKYFINGALVPKHDEEYGIRNPQGFQKIEELELKDVVINTPNYTIKDLMGNNFDFIGTKENSAGKPLPGVTVSIFDENKNALPANSYGKVFLKHAFTQSREWLETGYYGFMDECGFLVLAEC